MPTPVGHAIGGLAAAFLTNAAARRPRLTIAVALSSVALAVAPDLDIIAGWHRAHTHSIAAIAAVGLIAWLVLRTRTTDALPPTMALTAAFASHSLLDLLGKDTSPPRGPDGALAVLARRITRQGGMCSARCRDDTGFRESSYSAICVRWRGKSRCLHLYCSIAWAYWSKRTSVSEKRRRNNE